MKRRLSILLCVIMVLLMGLSACGSNDGTRTQNISGQPTGTAGPTVAADSTSTDKKKVDLTLFIDEPWWPYSKWEGRIPEKVSELTGVNIIPTVAVDDNQLQLMISSGDLPDMICSWKFDRLSSSSLCYSYNELIEKYAPDFEVDTVTQYVNTTLEDGKFYVIKNDFASPEKWAKNPKALHQGPGISFRRDILEGLGNPEIKTIADLENVFDQVLDKYPGVLPLITDGGFGYMNIQLGVHSDNFFEGSDGKLQWKGRDPQLLEYYKLLNKWYHKGYWAAENLTYKTADQYQQMLINGKAFALMGYDNSADMMNVLFESAGKDYYMQAQAEWISDQAKLYDYRTGWRGLFITKNCKDPEAAINFAKFIYSEEGQKLLLWGEENTDWHLDTEGYPAFDTWNPSDDNTIKPLGVRYWGWLSCDNIINGMGQGVGYEQTFDVKKYLTQHTERTVYIGMVNPPTDSDESATLSRLGELLTTENAKMLLADNESEVIENYNKMISMAEGMGLNSLESWANSVYPEIKEGYFKIAKE